MLCPDSLGPNQLVLISSLVSLALSDDLSVEELNVLGTSITAIGSLILTKAAQLAVQQGKQQKIQELEDQLQKIKGKP